MYVKHLWLILIIFSVRCQPKIRYTNENFWSSMFFFYFVNFFSFFLNLDNIIIKLVNVWGTMRKEAEVNQEPDFFFFFRATLGLYNSVKLTAQIDCHMT